jgi:hypothetical protein
MYEFFIHGSKPNNVLNIFKSDGLDEEFTSPDYHDKGIYCLYIYIYGMNYLNLLHHLNGIMVKVLYLL